MVINRIVMSVVLLSMVMVTMTGCLDFMNDSKINIIGADAQKVIKGVNDVGFIAEVPYTISLTEKVTLTWADKQADVLPLKKLTMKRVIDVDIKLGDVVKEQDRAIGDSATVKFYDFEERVGSVENSYISGNSIMTKDSYSFVTYKSAYLKDMTTRSDDSNASIQLVEDRDVLSSYAFQPMSPSMEFISAFPNTFDFGTTVTSFAIDPSLLDTVEFTDLSSMFKLRYGVELPSIEAGQTVLSKIKLNDEFMNTRLGNSFVTDNIIPVSTEDFTASKEKWQSLYKNALAGDIPPYIMNEVVFYVTINNLRGEKLTSVKISIPMPMILRSIKSQANRVIEYMKANNIGLNTIGDYSYTMTFKDKDVLNSNSALQYTPLQGKLKLFIPFKRLTSHFKLIDIRVTGIGAHFYDKYDTDKVSHPNIAVTGYSFPVLNAFLRVVDAFINGIRSSTGYIDPSYTSNYIVIQNQPSRRDNSHGSFIVV